MRSRPSFSLGRYSSFAQDWGSPAVIEIEGVEPFELYGYGRRLVWETPSYKGSLPSMYGTGINTLGFHAAVDFNDRTADAPGACMQPAGGFW